MRWGTGGLRWREFDGGVLFGCFCESHSMSTYALSSLMIVCQMATSSSICPRMVSIWCAASPVGGVQVDGVECVGGTAHNCDCHAFMFVECFGMVLFFRTTWLNSS